MKILLPNAAAAGSLQHYLERCGCIVTRVDDRTIEAAPPPRSLRTDLATTELQAYVHVWRELNPQVEVTIAGL
jgi:hypothetical protein